MPRSSTSFKPGNQYGRYSKRGPGIYKKLIQDISKHELYKMINQIRLMSLEEMEKIQKDKTQNAIFIGIIHSFKKFIKNGNPRNAEYFFNHLYGTIEKNLNIKSESTQTLIMKIDDNDW